MALPQKQLKQLKVELQNHDKALKELEADPQKDRADVRTRIAVHKIILRVARDPKVLKALEELHDNPEAVNQLASDPESFTQARGIQLPSHETKIVVLSQPPQPVVVGVEFHLSSLHFRLEWSKVSGFSVRQLPDRV